LKPEQVRIAIDAMGGDHGPKVIIPGAAHALEQSPDLRFLLFGDEGSIRPYLSRYPKLSARATIHHTDVAIRMDDKPSQALRAGRRTSSMWLAIEAVKKNEADVAVSAGNTGALMAMAKTCLRTLPGIDRPAIAGFWPTMRGNSVVLDLGATIGADADQLIDLAIMGAAMAQIILRLDHPTVGLLNIGVEEVKGLEEIKKASKVLREITLPTFDYRGFVEGGDIAKGTVDVVVTEGFTGNIALKTAEGTAVQIMQYLRDALGRTLVSRIGYLLARGALAALKEKIDPRKVNGGVFLGLEGIVIKSHGGSDVVATAGAIAIGRTMARNELVSKVKTQLDFAHAASRAAAELFEPAAGPVAASSAS
jgi:glycerol-3-phosphate acyltransferase PlsX